MRYLLDTHLLLWWLAEDPLLSDRANRAIADPENQIFVSAVSLWEIYLKHSLGKLVLPASFDETLAGELFEMLPLYAKHTRAVAALTWHHRDPFDRMLISQALCEGLTFLTADYELRAYGETVEFVGIK